MKTTKQTLANGRLDELTNSEDAMKNELQN